MTTAAVVLAAGGGTRFGGGVHKLLFSFRDRPVVAWSVEAAWSARLDETVVVWGAVDLDPAGLPVEVTRVHNPRWREGLATSLQAAVAHARRGGHGAVVVGLGDQPQVPPEAWRAVASSGAPVAVATYAGRRGHPVRLAEGVWAELPASGDAGARALLVGTGPPVQEVACEGAGPLPAADIDTVEDVVRWS